MWPSAFVAFLFALHPLHVESVAWIAERKDVLCAFFWFLALWAYVRGRRSLLYAAFCLGLMSKPMIVTLPFVLLLLDVWPLKRGMRIREKLPLFALAAAGAVITYAAQSGSGAVSRSERRRVANALVSYVVYLAKTFWPARLAVFYPYPSEIPVWQAIAAAAGAGGHHRGGSRRAAVAALRPGGMALVPRNTRAGDRAGAGGAQARADRYMYVPMVGLGIVLAWGAADLLRGRPRVQAALAAAALAACGGVAWAQTGYWQDSGTLFAHAIEVTDGNYVAEHNLGSYLMQQPGRLSQAIAHLREAARLRPESGQIHADLGSALARVPGGWDGGDSGVSTGRAAAAGFSDPAQ